MNARKIWTMSMSGLELKMLKGLKVILSETNLKIEKTLFRQKEAEELRERMEREKRELQEFIGKI